METSWFNFHNNCNLILDNLRRAVLLHDKTLLLKVVVGLYFVSLIGSLFSSVTTITIGKLYLY